MARTKITPRRPQDRTVDREASPEEAVRRAVEYLLESKVMLKNKTGRVSKRALKKHLKQADNLLPLGYPAAMVRG